MTKQSILLIQKPESPLLELIDQSLGERMGLAVSRMAAAPPPEAAAAASMVLWDTSGFEPHEVRIINPCLAQGGAMVVVACSGLDELTRQIVETAADDEARGNPAAKVIGLVQAPPDAGQLSALLKPPLEYAARIRALEAEVARLQEELDNRRFIERAKYALMFSRDLSENEAYRAMRQYSRAHNMRMIQVAARILKSAALLPEQPPEVPRP